ncbi:MAG: TonB-dependent receptor, plug, partial [Candidatus Solibacter sp.]|nr:TonB-dependent receptor, plug [Candidatus Solibacter sp.]
MFRYVAFLALLLMPVAAPGQQVTGSIIGTITDASGSAIVGATVKLVSEQTGAIRSVTADGEGNFVFTAINSGMYTVTAEQQGFKQYRKTGLELSPGSNIPLGIVKLEVGAVSESVTIRAEGSVVQTGTSERSGTVTSEEIQDLTVLNRDFTQFAELQPGIVANVTQEVQTFSGNTTFNAIGGRTTANNITIDGVTSSNTNQSNMNTTLSLDATASVEVKVANFQAEYGRNQGVTILAVSKGGSQKLHGALYYYFRNEDLNANNYFNNQNGTPRPEYRTSYAGGTFSGPLNLPRLKNRLFFLLGSEEIREMRPKSPQTVTVPTALERSGNFTQPIAGGKSVTVKDPTTGLAFPGNIIPANRILPSMQAYLNLLPSPNYGNTAISGGNYNYIFQESLNVPKRDETGRLDFNASDKTSMYIRYGYWWEDQQGAAVSAGNSAWGWLPDHYTPVTQTAIASVTHILNPSTVIQASLAYQRFVENGPPLSDALMQAKSKTALGLNIPQFFPENNPYNLVPAATFGGVTNAANPTYASRFPLRGVENTYTTNVSASKVTGPHTIKTGLYGERWAAMKGNNGTNFAGSMVFTQDGNNPLDTGYAYSNALLGVLDNYSEPSSRAGLYETTTSLEWYAQDTWKISRKLTMDAGVRFAFSQPWHSQHNQEAGWVPSTWNPANAAILMQPTLVGTTRMGLDPISKATYPAVTIGAVVPEMTGNYDGIVYRRATPDYPQGLRNNSGIRVAPRLGFAYDPFGNGKTVIRTGGGVFYNMHEADNFPNGIAYTQPIQYNSTVYYTYLDGLLGAKGLTFPGTVQGFDAQNKTSVTYNFSFNVQRDIGMGTVVDVAYVGALSRHLQARVNLNSTALGTNYLPTSRDATNKNAVLPSQFLRPYTGYGDINYYANAYSSSYHSLQTKVNRRFRKNLMYGVVWTWSKTMDYADANATTLSNNISQKIWNYGEAGYDHTHILRVFWNYNFPKASRLVNTKLVRGAFDGWQISGIYTAQSGAPLGISASYSPSQDVTGSTDGGRLLMVGDPVLAKSDQSFYHAFNTASVAPVPYAVCEKANPDPICWGNAPKYSFRGPGINSWDSSLFKNFSLTEKVRGQFRAEFYNVFNHTNFNGVDTASKYNAAG